MYQGTTLSRQVKVLIIDTEQHCRENLRDIFSSRGYHPIAVSTVDEALEALKSNSPDVVILDRTIAEINDWEPFRKIQYLSEKIPILLTSAQSSDDDSSVYALSHGAVDYIQKSPSCFDIVTRVENLMSIQDHDMLYGSASQNKPTVSLIIPTLNEAQNIPLLLPHIPLDWVDEVILVDGRSTDGTVEIARKILPSIKVVREQRPGKGAAMKAGYHAAKGDIIIVMDADGSNDPREIQKFVQALVQGSEFAKGSRFAPGGGTTDMPRIRQLGNLFFVVLTNLLFNGHFTDLCYGFHAFWRYCLDEIDLDDVDGFEIDTALYIRALQNRLRIVEVPSFEGYRFYGNGKLRTFPDGWRVLRTIMKEWVNHFKKPARSPYLGFRGTYVPFLNFLNTRRKDDEATARIYRLLFQITTMFLQAEHTPTDILGSILVLSIELMNATSGSILVFDQQGSIHAGAMAYGKKVININVKNRDSLDVVKQGLAGWVARNMQPALVQNTCNDPRWLRRPWDEGKVARSALGIPLTFKNQFVYVLTLARSEENQFTQADLQLIQNIQNLEEVNLGE